MFPKLLVIGLIASLVVACNRTGTASESPSDRDVQEIIDRDLHAIGIHQILIGKVTVTTSPANNFEKHEISQEEFKEVEAWHKVGLIQLSSEDVLSSNKGFTGWDNWLARTQNGALKRIKVSPTEKGVQLQKVSDLVGPVRPEFVYVRLNSSKIEEIIENQEVKKGADLFRIVKGKFATSWPDIGAQVYRARGWPMVHESKFILLLKYDPFKKQWKVVAGDVAPIDEEFKTTNVNNAITPP